MLGDVVLCPAGRSRQAAAAGHSAEAELHLLCTHGILHLLGYDHAEPRARREMFGLQARLSARGPTTAAAAPSVRRCPAPAAKCATPPGPAVADGHRPGVRR